MGSLIFTFCKTRDGSWLVCKNPELMRTYQPPFENVLNIVLNEISIVRLTVFKNAVAPSNFS